MEIGLAGQIVILDEAHNMEDSAREAASLNVAQDSLMDAIEGLQIMGTNIRIYSNHLFCPII